eukprot:jgi/Ulvmu1/8428/UM043_0006.1
MHAQCLTCGCAAADRKAWLSLRPGRVIAFEPGSGLGDTVRDTGTANGTCLNRPAAGTDPMPACTQPSERACSSVKLFQKNQTYTLETDVGWTQCAHSSGEEQPSLPSAAAWSDTRTLIMRV